MQLYGNLKQRYPTGGFLHCNCSLNHKNIKLLGFIISFKRMPGFTSVQHKHMGLEFDFLFIWVSYFEGFCCLREEICV